VLFAKCQCKVVVRNFNKEILMFIEECILLITIEYAAADMSIFPRIFEII